MAYNLAHEETVRAPRYAVRHFTDEKGRVHERSTRVATGEYVETKYKLWRCSFCRAWYCGSDAPKVCGKCHQ